MYERYGLEETEYKLFKYSEGQRAVTIGMTDGVTPVTVSFPIDDMVLEQKKRWDDNKKEIYLRHLIEEGKSLEEELLDSFHHIMLKIDMPSTLEGSVVDTVDLDLKAGDKVVVKLNPEEGGLEVVEGEDKVVKKPKKKKLSKK